jgi:phosphate/sulfate permease
MNDLLLIVVVGAALAFDFTNGFHDTANAMATTIATRALPPKAALGLAASLNFVGRSCRSAWRRRSPRASWIRARSR